MQNLAKYMEIIVRDTKVLLNNFHTFLKSIYVLQLK